MGKRAVLALFLIVKTLPLYALQSQSKPLRYTLSWIENAKGAESTFLYQWFLYLGNAEMCGQDTAEEFLQSSEKNLGMNLQHLMAMAKAPESLSPEASSLLKESEIKTSSQASDALEAAKMQGNTEREKLLGQILTHLKIQERNAKLDQVIREQNQLLLSSKLLQDYARSPSSTDLNNKDYAGIEQRMLTQLADFNKTITECGYTLPPPSRGLLAH